MYPPFANLGVPPLVSYGSLELTETSPPQSFVEPLMLAEMQSYLNLPEGNTEGDTLQALIAAARATAEVFQGRDLVRKQWDLHFDYWPAPFIALRAPLFSVDLVKYRDSGGAYTTLAENTDYVVDLNKKPGGIAPPWGHTWPAHTPWPSSSILVRFTSGLAADAVFWSDAGQRVKVGMRMLIAEWFSNRIPFGFRVEELPFKITACLGWGALPRAK
jgi:uncharacterized phiE125 gp8 family phage protein